MTTLRATGSAAGQVGGLLVALGVLGVAAVASVQISSHTIGPGTIWQAIVDYTGTDEQVIVREIRVPRAVLGVAVGAALAVAGTLIQTVTRNPLAEPGILGVTAGAGFAITLGSAFGLIATQTGELVLAVVGAAVAALLVYAVGRQSPLRLLLVGVALSAVLGGVSLGMRLMLPDTFDRFRFWTIGSLAGREQVAMTVPLAAIGIALLGALLVSRALDALSLGEDVAAALGTDVVRARLGTLVLVTVLAGAATAVAGPILFVGLIVPHLARRFVTGSIGWLVAYTMVLGPVLLLVSDVVARLLLPTGEVPVAVVTAFVGGPVLIWAVRRYSGGEAL